MNDFALKTLENDNSTILIPLKLKEPNKPQYKLTVPKQKLILEFLAKRWNYTKAAAAAGVNRKAISHHIDNQTNFGQAIMMLKEAKDDDVREVIITMATEASREGYNDRKLYAEANLPEYKRNAEIAVNIQVNNIQASGELSNFLYRVPADPSEK
jgi:hypothetical protein